MGETGQPFFKRLIWRRGVWFHLHMHSSIPYSHDQRPECGRGTVRIKDARWGPFPLSVTSLENEALSAHGGYYTHCDVSRCCFPAKFDMVRGRYRSSVENPPRPFLRCGKNFKPNETVVPPGGQFQLPASSNEPLVAFRCSPAFRPYLEADAKDATFIIDTPIVYQHIQGASPISLSTSGSSASECDDLGMLNVRISIGNHIFAKEEVPLNTTGYEIPLDLSRLSAQKASYNVTCDAIFQGKTSSSTRHFLTSTSLLYLPDTKASVVKTDLRTGALWTRPANGSDGDFKPFIPQGFYVSLDQQLAKNLSYIDQLKADGFNTVRSICCGTKPELTLSQIHPIPPYDDATLFEQVLNRTVELGLYFIYDMRSCVVGLSMVSLLLTSFLLPGITRT